MAYGRAAVPLVLMLTASCGGTADPSDAGALRAEGGPVGDTETGSSQGSPNADNAPVITAFETEDGASGPVSAVLGITDGCLHIETGSDGLTLVVFRYGSTWDASTATVTDVAGASVSVGQTLTATGEDHAVQDLVPWFVSDAELARLERCALSTGIADAYVLGFLEGGT